MADIVVFAQIQTTDNGNLTIDDKTDPTVPYSLVRNGVGSGSSAMSKVTVESPFVQGRTVVHQVKRSGAVILQVRVRGATFDFLDFYTAQLINFLENDVGFHLSITIDGTNHNWFYEAVDNWVVGDPQATNLGNWDDVSLRSYTQIVTAQTMRQPGSVAGRY